MNEEINEFIISFLSDTDPYFVEIIDADYLSSSNIKIEETSLKEKDNE